MFVVIHGLFLITIIRILLLCLSLTCLLRRYYPLMGKCTFLPSNCLYLTCIFLSITTEQNIKDRTPIGTPIDSLKIRCFCYSASLEHDRVGGVELILRVFFVSKETEGQNDRRVLTPVVSKRIVGKRVVSAPVRVVSKCIVVKRVVSILAGADPFPSKCVGKRDSSR